MTAAPGTRRRRVRQLARRRDLLVVGALLAAVTAVVALLPTPPAMWGVRSVDQQGSGTTARIPGLAARVKSAGSFRTLPVSIGPPHRTRGQFVGVHVAVTQLRRTAPWYPARIWLRHEGQQWTPFERTRVFDNPSVLYPGERADIRHVFEVPRSVNLKELEVVIVDNPAPDSSHRRRMLRIPLADAPRMSRRELRQDAE